MLTGLVQRLEHLKFLVNDNSTTILTGMGVSGTIATAYLTGRASFKAARIIQEENHMRELVAAKDDDNQVIDLDEITRFNKIKMVWRLYIPPVGVGITTIASIIVANKISSKKVAALTVASVISERSLQEYKAKVIEKLGERQSTAIREEIAQDRVTKYPIGQEVILAGTGEVLCYDMLTGRYFQSSVEEIKRAENKINHQLVNFMSASLSEFYDEVGLPPTPYTESVGWNMNNRMEVQFSTVMSSDNRPCIAIDFLYPPMDGFSHHHD